MPSSEAFVRTAASVRPSLRPITRVGVFCFAKPAMDLTSTPVQDLPELRVDFDIFSLLLMLKRSYHVLLQ
jgi:hypothetical protein